MRNQLSAFRLGDVRGNYPDELDEAFAQQFAHAFIHHFRITGVVATGRDMRESSTPLQAALNEGLMESGIHVQDLGMCTTELGYFASAQPGIAAAIIVTASHNPARDNGFKCVLRSGDAVTFDSGLDAVMALMIEGYKNPLSTTGSLSTRDLRTEYITFLKSRVEPNQLRSGHIALNGLNGTAVTLAEALADDLELPVTWFRRKAGPIPTEGADPANPVLIAQMKDFMQSSSFSAGVAWDGDCDRCVFFSAAGDLIPTYYVIGLFAGHFLQRHKGGTIVFDKKLFWNTLDVINEYDGIALPAKTGHAFMKREMHQSGAIYGGELSSHHYFGDFYGCDSGMLAWLKIIQIVNQSGLSLDELILQQRQNVCCTPEINLSLVEADVAFQAVLSQYEGPATRIDHFDGLSFEMPGNWRFSLCKSKTEPLVRVNFESREKAPFLLENAAELLRFLGPYGADESLWSEKLTII